VLQAVVIELTRFGSNRNARWRSAPNRCDFSYLPRQGTVEA